MALSVCWLYLCHGFVFLSSAAAGTGSQLFEPASTLTYSYQSTLLLNEVTPDLGKDVGFRVTAQLSVETVWQSASSPGTKLLLLKVINRFYFKHILLRDDSKFSEPTRNVQLGYDAGFRY